MTQNNKCWGITDGSAGMTAQITSLAEAMNIPIEMKIIAFKTPWQFLPNQIYNGICKKYILTHILRTPVDCSEPPDLIISCGRKAAAVSVALKQLYPKVKTIHIQDPQMSPDHFDLVIAMEHDSKISGKNVIKTRFALHNITNEKLEKAQEKFAPRFAAYPKPHIAVLLGGSTNKYRLHHGRMEQLITYLKTIQGSLLITPSRRTGEENIASLAQQFSGYPNIYIYQNIDENPYLGLLACADEIYVTNDSVNMMTEAYASGKKVTIIELPDHKNTKPARFADIVKTKPMYGNEMENLARYVTEHIYGSCNAS